MNLRNTPAKSSISDFLSKTKTPVSAEEIISFLRSKQLGTNKTTVYRIISSLYENGLIDRIELGEGKFRYEAKKEDHHHFICEHCGLIEDISDCDVPEFENEIQKKHKFLVKRHSLEFFGLCKNCQL